MVTTGAAVMLDPVSLASDLKREDGLVAPDDESASAPSSFSSARKDSLSLVGVAVFAGNFNSVRGFMMKIKSSKICLKIASIQIPALLAVRILLPLMIAAFPSFPCKEPTARHRTPSRP